MRSKSPIIRKILKAVIQFGILAALITLFTHISVLAAYLPIPDESTQIFEDSKVPTPPGIFDTDQPLDGLAWAKILVLNALSYAKVIFAVIGILFITIVGYRMLSKGDEEDTITKSKKTIIYIVIGLILLSMAEDIGRLFDMEKQSMLASPQEILNRVHIFDKQVEMLITFIKYILGSYAVLMVVRSAGHLITGGGKEEETTKHKKNILYSLGGLVLVYAGDIFVSKVFYKVDKTSYSGITGVHPTVDPQEGVSQIIGITNLIVSFVGPAAILMLIVGAIMYAVAAGEEEKTGKAKRILMAAGIGIIIIYGAFAVVSTVIAGRIGPAIVE